MRKPEIYAKMGVQEYFAYDPNSPRLWRKPPTRLRGWSFDNGAVIERYPDDQGRLWSAHLESWLVPDGAYLRLFDRDGTRRMTQIEAAEAEAVARRVEQHARYRAEVALADERRAREEAEARVAAERATNDRMRAKLRELGFDPDSVR